MRASLIFVVIVALAYTLCFCTSLSLSLYNCFFVSSGKGGADVPREGLGRLLMQLASLCWKNVKVNTRTELPCCFACCSGCCMQMLCPIVYIFLLTALPCIVMHTTGASAFLEAQHPMQYGRNYSDNLVLSAVPHSMQDYLFQEPTISGLIDPNVWKKMMADPLQALWHPWGAIPQGACFCRTLGVVGTGASDFQRFAKKVYKEYTEASSRSALRWMDQSLVSRACPSNFTGTLFRVFPNEEAVEGLLKRFDYSEIKRTRSEYINDKLCGLIVFENNPAMSVVPKFRVRTNITGMDPLGSAADKKVTEDPKGVDKTHLAWYLQSGFLSMQDLVQRFIADTRVGHRFMLPEPNFVPLPTPPYRKDAFKEAIAMVIAAPSTATNTFTVTIMLITYYMIRERNTKQKEMMRLMGLYDSSLALSWVTLFAILNLGTALGASFLVYAVVVDNSDFFILFLIFFLTGMATITLGMVVSSLISTERLGALLAFAVYNILGLIYHSVVPGGELLKDQAAAQRDKDVHPHTLLLVSIFPNIAFVLSAKTYFALDQGRSGCTWRRIYHSVMKFNVGGGLAMLVFDFFFWGGIYMYLDQVIEHSVGTARPWYFPLTPSFWREFFGWEDHLHPRPAVTGGSPGSQGGRLFESEDSAQLQQLRHRNLIISVRGLHKTFVNANGAQIHAVNGLDLTMYEGECFCLLGHNGAGKTTAMGLITGMLTPTAGEVHVLGHRMPEERLVVRQNMGFCMQQNVLWDTLTVHEHIQLFGALMGYSMPSVAQASSQVLAKVELAYKQHSWASALSGGMKRKLNVALALLGDSKVIMLDEPTAGMDPHTRRRLWGVLKQSRAERIVCLTTHYMDEADELGDRVCIMVHGQAACCGTNSFLKRQLGCGYMLSFVKAGEDSPSDPIEALVRHHCGDGVYRAACVGRELRVRVPFSGAAAFPALMLDLDAKLDSMGLESYGIGVSDLEDVFLRVANGDELQPALAVEHATAHSEKAPVELQRASSEPSMLCQFLGLFQRRVRYGFRDSRMFCCQLFVPIIIMVFFLGLSKLHERSAAQFARVDLDTSDWNTDIPGGMGPTLVSVGVIGSLTNPALDGNLESGWQVGHVPGISEVSFNSSLDTSGHALPPCAEREQYIKELAFADWAFNDVRPAEGVPQFGGVLYSGNRVTIFPNTSVTIAAPTLLNLHFAAAMAAAKANGRTRSLPPDHLEMSSQPFGVTAKEHEIVAAFSSFAMGLVVLSAYSFIATGIASYITMEKEMEVKHQLMVSGTRRLPYWLSNFAFDSVFGLFSGVGTLIVLAIFGAEAFCSSPNIFATVALLLLFTPAVSAFAYFMSHFFETAGGALVGVLLFGLFVGSFGLQISGALILFPKTKTVGLVLLWLVRALLPSACVGDGLTRIAMFKDYAKIMHISPFNGYLFGTQFCSPGGYTTTCVVIAGDACAMLVLDAVGYSLLLWLADAFAENPAVRKWLSWSPDPICPWDLRRQEDVHVMAEKKRVGKLDPASQVLVVDNVCKVYKGTVHAVRGISFAVEAGNVFGLLGTNGAGKTTTFKMICGQIAPSSGRVLVKGLDVEEDLYSVRKHIGYCPQFDALLDLMTVREHLELYAQIKGLTGLALNSEVAERLQTLSLTEFTHSRAGQLSGGNKRKLSCAVAMVGEPEVVFLDEPSAGMDPVARRHMWDVIQSMAQRRHASAVILTTHSMEEADALCSRIAIQCSGQLRCLGTPQQLKEWYGTGLELNLRLQTPARSQVEALCGEWKAGPETTCPGGKGRQLVSDFLLQRRMRDREVPMAGQLDSVCLGALSEWCLQEAQADAVAAFLVEKCGDDKVSCVERAAGSLRYKLTGTCPGGGPLPYGELFGLLQDYRERLQLADFQLSQGTLEQTFNRLAAEDLERRGDDGEGGP